jgi:hypothetical protein
MPRHKTASPKRNYPIRLQESLIGFLQTQSEKENRTVANLIETAIIQYLKPLGYDTNLVNKSVYPTTNRASTQNPKSKPIPLVNDSIAKISEPEPIEPIEIRRNPYAKD